MKKITKSVKRGKVIKSKMKPLKMPKSFLEMKKKLLVMREDLLKTVKKTETSMTQAEVGDEADVAMQSIERETLFELSDNERILLDSIEAALRKFSKFTYGFCEICRKSIPRARLKVIPFARYCVSCQTKSEQPR